MGNTKIFLTAVIAIIMSMLACINQPQTIVETVIVEVTSTPEPTDTPVPIPTEAPELDMDSFRGYTQIIFTDMYGSCVGLSRKDWATTNFTINLMDRAQAAECVRLISAHEIPANCEFDTECNQLSTLAIEYTTLITDGWKLFKKGEDTLNEDLISDGLGMFWDADELWIEIIEVIHDLEDKHSWEIT